MLLGLRRALPPEMRSNSPIIQPRFFADADLKNVRAYLDVQVELPQAGVISLNLEGGGAAAGCWGSRPGGLSQR